MYTYKLVQRNDFHKVLELCVISPGAYFLDIFFSGIILRRNPGLWIDTKFEIVDFESGLYTSPR